jgi:hypothetical protein
LVGRNLMLHATNHLFLSGPRGVRISR